MENLLAAEIGKNGGGARGWGSLLLCGLEPEGWLVWLVRTRDVNPMGLVNSNALKMTFNVAKNKTTHFFAGISAASSLVSISLELPDSLSDSDPESEPESEPDESEESEDSDDSSSTSSLVLVAAFTAFFCVFSGSGEVDLLELLSLEEEEAAAIVAWIGALRCARMNESWL